MSPYSISAGASGNVFTPLCDLTSRNVSAQVRMGGPSSDEVNETAAVVVCADDAEVDLDVVGVTVEGQPTPTIASCLLCFLCLLYFLRLALFFPAHLSDSSSDTVSLMATRTQYTRARASWASASLGAFCSKYVQRFAKLLHIIVALCIDPLDECAEFAPVVRYAEKLVDSAKTLSDDFP